MDIYTIENKYGSLIINSGQKPTIGLQPFAEYFSSLSGCIFMPNEKRFYIYNRSNGLWESQSQEAMISKISEEIQALARAAEINDGIMKSLVGDDALRVELKHSNEAQMIQGTYNVFIVGNAVPVLEFESDDDISTWLQEKIIKKLPRKEAAAKH